MSRKYLKKARTRGDRKFTPKYSIKISCKATTCQPRERSKKIKYDYLGGWDARTGGKI
jgi:hypothetical protein